MHNWPRPYRPTLDQLAENDRIFGELVTAGKVFLAEDEFEKIVRAHRHTILEGDNAALLSPALAEAKIRKVIQLGVFANYICRRVTIPDPPQDVGYFYPMHPDGMHRIPWHYGTTTVFFFNDANQHIADPVCWFAFDDEEHFYVFYYKLPGRLSSSVSAISWPNNRDCGHFVNSPLHAILQYKERYTRMSETIVKIPSFFSDLESEEEQSAMDLFWQSFDLWFGRKCRIYRNTSQAAKDAQKAFGVADSEFEFLIIVKK